MSYDRSLLSENVVGWFEHGVTRFNDYAVACDASVARFDDDFLAVSGAAVSEEGAWWAWRAFVRSGVDGLFGNASYWAEYVTLVLTANRVDRGIVLCDLVGAVETVSRQLVGLDVPENRRRALGRIATWYGRLPDVERSCAKRVMHVGRMDSLLHRRAHLVAGHVRRAVDGTVHTQRGRRPLVSYCNLIAHGLVEDER